MDRPILKTEDSPEPTNNIAAISHGTPDPDWMSALPQDGSGLDRIGRHWREVKKGAAVLDKLVNENSDCSEAGKAKQIFEVRANTTAALGRLKTEPALSGPF